MPSLLSAARLPRLIPTASLIIRLHRSIPRPDLLYVNVTYSYSIYYLVPDSKDPTGYESAELDRIPFRPL